MYSKEILYYHVINISVSGKLNIGVHKKVCLNSGTELDKLFFMLKQSHSTYLKKLTSIRLTPGL